MSEITSYVSKNTSSASNNPSEKNESVDRLEKERRLRLIVFKTIVQLSDTVSTEFLLQKLNYLDVNSWLEVAEERYIGHICGFPCCSNTVVAKRFQKYRIDRKNKKVFERSTDRDKFCSENCYSRFSNLRLQLSNEPLWLRGIQEQKNYSLDEHLYEGSSYEKVSPLVEYVEERIEKRLTDLFVGGSNDTDEEKEESKVHAEKLKDDENFANEISNYLSQRMSISNRTSVKNSASSSAAAKTKSLSTDVTDARNCHNSNLTSVFKASQLSEDEKLEKIRNKYAVNKTRCGPPLVDPKPLELSATKKSDSSNERSLEELIREYFGPKALEYLRHSEKDDISDNNLTTAERMLQHFYSGDEATDKNNEDVFLPRVDNVNQASLRRDVFASFIKPSFYKLEAQLKTKGLYEKAQPLIGSLSLNASNVDVRKTEAHLLVAFLFRMLLHYDSSLRDRFFSGNVACDSFKNFIESTGCSFSAFQATSAMFLKTL